METFYRPISLLSVTSKLLERHIHQLITDHLSDNYPLANTQWGFQPAKSTVTALLSTTYDWLEEMEAGRDICSVFLNLKKAFNTVSHQFLMEKLVWLNLNHSFFSGCVATLWTGNKRLWLEERNQRPSQWSRVCHKDRYTWSAFISNLYWCYQDPIVWRKQASALCWWYVIV